MRQKQAILNSISLRPAQAFRGQGRARHGLYHLRVFAPLFLLLLILHAPVALLWLKIIPFEHRFHALFCVLAGFIYFCCQRRYNPRELGFRTDNLKASMGWNLLFCAVGAIGLYATYKAGFLRPDSQHNFPQIYVFYIFFLGPIQEVVFRGILFAEMKRLQNVHSSVILLISSFSFCFLHIIYRHPPLLIIALISGLSWGAIFLKKPNIWGIAFSHSVLGALAMFLGVI